jgi:Tol biopolymer transport system component
VRVVDDEHRLIGTRVEGGAERIIARTTKNRTWLNLWESAPAWSNDGQRVFSAGWIRESGRDRPVLFEIRVADGSFREIATRSWESIQQVVSLRDGTGVVVVARETSSSPSQIWVVDPRTGAGNRITNDVTDYGKLKVSEDARRIAVEQQLSYQHIWFMPAGDASRMRQLTSGVKDWDGHVGLTWTPDGRILLVSDRSGKNEIWSMNTDGGDARQLTVGSATSNVSPRPTPDGRYVVFCSTRDGGTHIWRMDANGGNELQLTHGDGENGPEVSADGRWVYYTDYATKRAQIARVPIDGGPAVILPTAVAASSPVASPDGAMLAFDSYDEREGWRNGVMPATGGEPRFFAWHSARGQVRWTRDSRAIVFNRNTENLWLQPIDGGEPRPLTHFGDGRIWSFALAPNGRDLVMSRGDIHSDIVLIQDFR